MLAPGSKISRNHTILPFFSSPFYTIFPSWEVQNEEEKEGYCRIEIMKSSVGQREVSEVQDREKEGQCMIERRRNGSVGKSEGIEGQCRMENRRKGRLGQRKGSVQDRKEGQVVQDRERRKGCVELREEKNGKERKGCVQDSQKEGQCRMEMRRTVSRGWIGGGRVVQDGEKDGLKCRMEMRRTVSRGWRGEGMEVYTMERRRKGNVG